MQTVLPSPDDRLTPKEAATLTGLSEATLATKRCRGGGPTYLKVNGKVFYRRSDVDAFLAAHTIEFAQEAQP